MFRFVFAAVLVLPSALFAQGQYATISGIVTDSTGAIVPEAVINATNVGTGETHNAVSNHSGVDAGRGQC